MLAFWGKGWFNLAIAILMFVLLASDDGSAVHAILGAVNLFVFMLDRAQIHLNKPDEPKYLSSEDFIFQADLENDPKYQLPLASWEDPRHPTFDLKLADITHPYDKSCKCDLCRVRRDTRMREIRYLEKEKWKQIEEEWYDGKDYKIRIR